jgi:tRNA A-37 threonylcarbamoyl transferase component Bud32/uncharacterized RDD family membrane protein YckC
MVWSEAITLVDGPSSKRAFAATAYEAERPLPPPGSSQDDPLIGRNVDHFEIQALLGEGGMGRVYLAKDRSLDRPVALKLLRRELAQDPILVGRLVNEARAQARLQHPNVVTIYYIGLFEGDSYFVMEYIHGKTVAERIRDQGPLEWAEALEVILDTARALAAAHRKEMIHRDIKPSNLILGEISPGAHRAHIKVTDFGLATDTHQAEGRFVGTPYYAAPEQIAGTAADFRSDIYSLAVTFYELLTGKVPFIASDLPSMAKLHQMADRPVIPDHVAPWRLRQLINQMMDPDPSRRPSSYDELIARLEALRFRPRMAGGLIARGAAVAVDLAFVSPIGPIAIAVFGWSQIMSAWLGGLLFAAYSIVTHRLWGQTLGKRLLGLQLVGTTRRITVPRLLLRFVVQFWGPLAALLAISLQWGAGRDLLAVKDHLTQLGGLHPLWDRTLESLLRTVLIPNLVVVLPWLAGFVFGIVDHDRQTLHDRAAHTRVLFHVSNEDHS